jgi:hypothetical protein
MIQSSGTNDLGEFFGVNELHRSHVLPVITKSTWQLSKVATCQQHGHACSSMLAGRDGSKYIDHAHAGIPQKLTQ